MSEQARVHTVARTFRVRIEFDRGTHYETITATDPLAAHIEALARNPGAYSAQTVREIRSDEHAEKAAERLANSLIERRRQENLMYLRLEKSRREMWRELLSDEKQVNGEQ